ncbi:MAG: hypothetical protein V7K98_15840 [Nostoc sp.]|uniref:hypothetical protein n=1 Tax=Nostoc sp. TaxID=1180 RepID=UPI002FF598DE
MIGTALSLALTANIAVAESSKSPIAQSTGSESTSAPTEIKMSPQGMKILCEYFPLNSRCPGGTALTPSAPASTPAPAETTPPSAPGSTSAPAETPPGTGTPDSAPAPGTVTPPEPGAPSNLTPAPGTVTPPEPGAPSNLTPAPGTVTPSEPGAPSNLTPAPGTVTPSQPGNPTEPGANSPTPSTPSTPGTGN